MSVRNETWDYKRMSTDRQEDSPLTQDQYTSEFISVQELPTWTRTYFDLGISGGSVEKRPGMMALLTDAERLRPACILFYKLDRAFRNAGEQAVALRRFKKLGIRVLKVRDPNIDGYIGTLVDTILGGVAEFERQLVGARIRDHNETMARNGLWTGGVAPYGYRYLRSVHDQHGKKKVTVQQGRLAPEPAEWSVARQIWDWALSGYRLSEIADLANQAGYRRRKGGLWGTDALAKLLSSRFYAGYIPYAQAPRMKPASRRHWENTNWYPGEHPAMVSLAEFFRVAQTTLTKLGQRQANRRPLAELAGLIRCSLCGGPVVSVGRDKHHPYYYGCGLAGRKEAGHPAWRRAPWVAHMGIQTVLDQVAGNLVEIPPVDIASQAVAEQLTQEISRLQYQRRRLQDLYVLGEFDNNVEAFQQRARELDSQISSRNAALAQTEPTGTQLQERWEQLRCWEQLYLAADSVREKQRVWALFVEKVEMAPLRVIVHMRNFGNDIPRTWAVNLPPLRTRRPVVQ